MNFIYNEDGQSMLEYSLIIGLIAVVAIVSIALLGNKIRNYFMNVNDSVKD